MAAEQWLEAVRQSRAAYKTLLQESGCLAMAAHRLARAKCQTWMFPSNVPSVRELHAAAYEIAEQLGTVLDLPPQRVLATQCRELGLDLM